MNGQGRRQIQLSREALHQEQGLFSTILQKNEIILGLMDELDRVKAMIPPGAPGMAPNLQNIDTEG